MQKNDYVAWAETMGRDGRRISDRAASDVLGIARGTVRAYREGRDMPKVVRMACAAAAFGLPAWRS